MLSMCLLVTKLPAFHMALPLLQVRWATSLQTQR